MASKLDVLKRYQSKKKKKSKNQAPKDSNNIHVYDDDEQNIKPAICNSKALDQPGIMFENDIIEADEIPVYFLEDGVTRVPQDYIKSMSNKQGKWVPVGSYLPDKTDSPKKDIPPASRQRHDSDSEEDITNAISESKYPSDDDFSPDRQSS
ncbi:hypothetical protein MXB_1643, partial [Myxobolus squamalis]